MLLSKTLQQLEALGDAKMRAHHVKNGSGENVFGVKLGDLRTVAKRLKTDHPLGLALWETGNIDAQFLAALVMDPQRLSTTELDALVRSLTYSRVADWLISYVVAVHPEREALRQQWMSTPHPWAARAGWSLTATRIEKSPAGLDLPALLDRIESELGTAAPEVQWTMNGALAAIGIHHPALRERALAIGEKLGIYRDYPCAKGCTSPFAPIWIGEMVKRQGKKN